MRRLQYGFILVPALLGAQAAPRPISLTWQRFDEDLSGPAPVACPNRATGADLHVECRLALEARMEIVVRHTPGFELLLLPPEPGRGDRSSSLKLVSQRLVGDTLILQVQGVAGRGYSVPVRTPHGVVRVQATMPPGGDRVDGYSERELRITAPM